MPQSSIASSSSISPSRAAAPGASTGCSSANAEALDGAAGLVCLPQELFDIERTSLAGVERANPLVDIASQHLEPLDMGEQLTADLFLIGVRQVGNLCKGLFERLDHDAM